MLVSTLHKETEGNPFFLSEVLHLLARDEDLTLTPFPIPHSVRETIRRRLAQLSPACLQLLMRAAIIGREFTLDLLLRSNGVQTETDRLQILTLVQEALTARLLVDASDKAYTYRFVHALIRERLYEDLALPERIRLHRHIGEAIENLYAGDLGPYLAELADHFFKAAAGERSEKALQYALQAGERANGLLAHEEAAVYYERAFQLLPSQSVTGQRGEILLSMGHALARAGEPKRARATFSQAAAIARDLRTQGESRSAALLLARAALGFSGHGDIATRFDQPMVNLLEEALAALPEEDSPLRVRVLGRLAMALYFSPFIDRCDSLSHQAVEMARRLGETTALAYALNARHIALIGPDTVHERLALATEMIHLAEEEGRKELALAGHLGRIMGWLELGDRRAIDQELPLYTQLVAELRQPFYLWHATVLQTMATILAGQLTEAERLVQEGLTLGQQVQTPNAFLLFTVQLFALYREQGRLQELEETTKNLVERFPAIPGLRTALAFLYGEIGHESDARTQFEQVAAKNFTDMVRDQGWLGSMTNLSQVAFFLKDKERASLLYELLLPYAERNVIVGSANDCFGAVARYLGLLATTMERWDEAASHFADALAINERVHARLFVAHTQYDYATMLLTRSAQGDRTRAQSLLDQALAAAQELGMPRLEEKIISLVQSSRFKVQSIENGSQYLEVRSQQGAVPSPQSAVQGPTDKKRSSHSQTLDSGPWTPDTPPNFLRREGDYWTVGYDGTVVRLQDTKGLTHLVCLLREPQQEFHVLDLLAMTDGVPFEGSGTEQHEIQALQLHPTTEFVDARALPDRQARTVYQQRLQVLREELAEAERFNDSGRARTLRIELDFLTTEVAAAYGASTHTRRRNEDTEKVRKTVAHRIRTVLTKIKKVHPSLWRHLHVSLKTGTFCSYNPEKLTDWEV
jgi:tetratricopeptide (TPR) repeat protein